MNVTNSNREKRAGLIAQADNLLNQAESAGRGLTQDEVIRFDAWMDEAETLNRKIRVESEKSDLSAILPRKVDEPLGSYNHHLQSQIFAPPPSGTLRAFENSARGRETAHNFGLWLSANLLGDEKAIRRCGERGIEFNPRAAQSTSTNAAGGALVPQQFADTVIRLVEDYGVVRQAAQVFPMTSDSAVVPVRESGLTASYTSENAAIDESDASWSNVTLSPKKLATRVKFSTELSEDALGVVSDMLALECGTAFALTEDTSCLIGDGTSPTVA